MILYKPSNGMGKLRPILADIAHETRLADHRWRIAHITGIFFLSCFVTILAIETLLAAMMLSVLQVEILGHIATGAMFALLVPIAMGTLHIKIHRDGDWLTKAWLGKVSSIGLLFFAFGLSFTVGYSAWQAATDAVSSIASAPSGRLGSQDISGAPDQASGLISWIAPLPNALLFLGLSFGMVISMYFASFCLGRFIEAWGIISKGPRVSKAARAHVEAANAEVKAYTKKACELEIERRRLPFDPKHRFAREAAQLCGQVAQSKLTIARRKFVASGPTPLGAVFNDPEVETIPSYFTSEEDFARHIADQMDATRVHHILHVLSGIPEQGDNQ